MFAAFKRMSFSSKSKPSDPNDTTEKKTDDNTNKNQNNNDSNKVSNEDKKESNNKGITQGGELDLIFLVDCTASMSSYIDTAQKSIAHIVEKIMASEKADVQFGLVGYRDFCDKWVTRSEPLTSSVSVMKGYINKLSAEGGGDLPEAVTAGLDEILKINFRKNSTKIVILIGDAPDHGLGENGDSYPNGDKEGRDPLVIARQMSDKGIMLYAVGCEPALSNSQFGRDFFMTLAKITNGQYLPLANSHLLPDAIISGAREELSLDRLTDKMENEIKKIKEDAKSKGETLSEEQVVKQVFLNFKEAGVKSSHMKVDSLYSSAYDVSNVNLMEKTPTLAEARKKFQHNLNANVRVDNAKSASQQAYTEENTVSYEQVTRAYSKAAKTKWNSSA